MSRSILVPSRRGGQHDANPHSETLWQIDHPGRSIRGGFAHFLDVASTPPHEDGNIAHPNFLFTPSQAGEYSAAAVSVLFHPAETSGRKRSSRSRVSRFNWHHC